MESISDIYNTYLDEILRLYKDDNDKWDLVIKYIRPWKERLFSRPWRPWIKYSKKELYKDVDFSIDFNNIVRLNSNIDQDSFVTLTYSYEGENFNE